MTAAILLSPFFVTNIRRYLYCSHCHQFTFSELRCFLVNSLLSPLTVSSFDKISSSILDSFSGFSGRFVKNTHGINLWTATLILIVKLICIEKLLNKKIERFRFFDPEMNRNRFNEGMTSINTLISFTVETYFDKLYTVSIRFQNTYSRHGFLNYLELSVELSKSSGVIIPIIFIVFNQDDHVSRYRTPCTRSIQKCFFRKLDWCGFH